MRAICALLLAAALLFEPYAALAKHKTRHHSYGRHYSTPQQDRARYDYSGTRGRMGLGANPRRPEGPGNFSSPR
jgi:hypothetical protein